MPGARVGRGDDTGAGQEPGGLRVVIGEDSVLLRESLATLLARHGFVVAGVAGDLDEVLAAVDEHRPDVALLDIRMPPTHTDEGLRAAKEIAERHPGMGALVLSQYVDAGFAMRLLEQRTPGRGYLLKDRIATIDALLDAVRTVGSGGTYVDAAVVGPLVRAGEDVLSSLSARELDILGLMAEGRSNSAISSSLFLSPKTVEAHVRSIFLKLGLPQATEDHRRVLAVLTYLRSARSNQGLP